MEVEEVKENVEMTPINEQTELCVEIFTLEYAKIG